MCANGNFMKKKYIAGFAYIPTEQHYNNYYILPLTVSELE